MRLAGEHRRAVPENPDPWSSPSAERRSAVRGFRSRSDSGSFAALRSNSGGPQRERAALFHSLVLSLDDPLSDLMTRGGGSQSADANVNNGLSSARRETALKVQVPFAPHFSLRGYRHVGESVENCPYACGLRSRAGPENDCVGPNRKNRAKPLPARFCWIPFAPVSVGALQRDHQ